MAKILSKKSIGFHDVYDISMPEIHNFVAEGIVAHNCDFESRDPLVGKDGNSGYLFGKYGNKAAQISTRTLLRVKSAILDVNRFVNGGKVEEEVASLSKSLPNTPQGINDHDFIFGYEDSDGNHVSGLLEQNEDLQKYAVARKNEWEMVQRALSLARQNSRHACAYIISDKPIEKIVPIMEISGVKRVTQVEAKQVEAAGLIKYDFLVVSSLKDINACIRYINKKNGNKDLETGHFLHNEEEVYIWDLPEDKDVFRSLSEGKTESVFQLNTTSVTPFVKKIRPRSIVDCAIITSLVRPGPLDFIDEKTGRNMAEEYYQRRIGNSKGDMPILDKLIPETYAVITFQEQISLIAKEVGQMDVIDAENVRIGMGKKKIKLLESLKPKFIEGAKEKVGIETAEKLWAMMATFAGYGFNYSHSVAYSVISYACAFLKHHYPLEWWASVLSNATDKEINEVFYKYVKDKVLPPDVNTSTEQIEVDYNLNKIRNKLSMITGLGVKYAESIIVNRPYKDIKDFVKKDVAGPSMTKKLIYVGALDSLFKKDTILVSKMYEYEKAVVDLDFEDKIRKKEESLNSAEESEKTRIIKAIEKMKAIGPKIVAKDGNYESLSPKQDFLVKKSIFPMMNIDLTEVLKRESKQLLLHGKEYMLIKHNIFRKEFRLMSGDKLQSIDNTDVKADIDFCVAGYVMDTKEFTYQKDTKKALKIIIDSSGYISEKVLWPDYDTGVLSYPKSLKKGAIVYFFYRKKVGKPYTNITHIEIEEESILS